MKASAGVCGRRARGCACAPPPPPPPSPPRHAARTGGVCGGLPAVGGRGRAVKAVGGARPCDAVRTGTHQGCDLSDVRAHRCLRDARVPAPVRAQPSVLLREARRHRIRPGQPETTARSRLRASRWAEGVPPEYSDRFGPPTEHPRAIPAFAAPAWQASRPTPPTR
jgi:hypothetical protein